MLCTIVAIQLISICSPLTDYNKRKTTTNIKQQHQTVQVKMHDNSICGKKNTKYTQCEATGQHIKSK